MRTLFFAACVAAIACAGCDDRTHQLAVELGKAEGRIEQLEWELAELRVDHAELQEAARTVWVENERLKKNYAWVSGQLNRIRLKAVRGPVSMQDLSDIMAQMNAPDSAGE